MLQKKGLILPTNSTTDSTMSPSISATEPSQACFLFAQLPRPFDTSSRLIGPRRSQVYRISQIADILVLITGAISSNGRGRVTTSLLIIRVHKRRQLQQMTLFLGSNDPTRRTSLPSRSELALDPQPFGAHSAHNWIQSVSRRLTSLRREDVEAKSG